jgi:SAM-dependent methyltransferase
MSDSPSDPTRRFASRVDHYVRYRPGYPTALVDAFRDELDWKPTHRVADVGSGTGILTWMLLELGNTVYGVEPNEPMRRAAEALLSEFTGFSSVDGTAEATGLEDASVDLVTAAQAFHWFRPDETRREFERILVPGGRVALVWNRRLVDTTPFLRGYEELLHRYGVDYRQVDHRSTAGPDAIARFFRGDVASRTFANEQRLDHDGVIGRAMSSSYVPDESHPNHQAMFRGLEELFDDTSEDGFVRIEYVTELHHGRLP